MADLARGVPWETAVVVRVPELDELIAGLRKRYGLPRKPNGIPPHITLIVPFLRADELCRGGATEALRSVCAKFEPFDVTFARTARFPRVLYLAPEPAEPFVALSRAIMDRWPQVQPYPGRHRAVVPHLTVTTSRPPKVFGAVAEALRPRLPVTITVAGAHVYTFDGRAWSEHAAVALGG